MFTIKSFPFEETVRLNEIVIEYHEKHEDIKDPLLIKEEPVYIKEEHLDEAENDSNENSKVDPIQIQQLYDFDLFSTCFYLF